MARKEEIANYAQSFKGKGMEIEELKDIIRLAIIDGALWADKTMIDKVCEWLKSYRQETNDGTGYIAGIVNDKTIEDLRKAMLN